MKKIFLFSVVFLFVLLLTGCNNKAKLLNPSDALLVVGIDGSYGLIDQKGNEVVSLEYDSISRCFAYYVAKKDDNSALINDEGNIVFELENGTINQRFCEYEYSAIPEEKLLVFSSTAGAYGIVNMMGEKIVPATYSNIYDLSDSSGYFLAVTSSSEFDIINGLGNIIATVHYGLGTVLTASYYGGLYSYGTEELIPVIDPDTDLYGYVNFKGDKVIDLVYNYANVFIDGQAIVKENDLYGVIDTDGDEIIPSLYQYIKKVVDNHYIVEDENDKYALFDGKGNNLTEFDSDYMSAEYSMLAGGKGIIFEQDNKEGFMNLDGDILIPAEYDSLDLVAMGTNYIIGENGDTSKVFDTDGIEIISITNANYSIDDVFSDTQITIYDSSTDKVFIADSEGNELYSDLSIVDGAYTFDMEYYVGRNETGFILFKEDGVLLTDEIYDYTPIFTLLDVIAVEKDDKWAFVNKKGETVTEFKYDDVQYWNYPFYFIGLQR